MEAPHVPPPELAGKGGELRPGQPFELPWSPVPSSPDAADPRRLAQQLVGDGLLIDRHRGGHPARILPLLQS